MKWQTELPYTLSASEEYWWFKSRNYNINEPQIVLVRLFRGYVRAFFLAGGVQRIDELSGLWAGPLPQPEKEDAETV